MVPVPVADRLDPDPTTIAAVVLVPFATPLNGTADAVPTAEQLAIPVAVTPVANCPPVHCVGAVAKAVAVAALPVVLDVMVVGKLPAANVPVTPVDSGKPVALVSTKADGVPRFGVTNVGDVDCTTAPVPVLDAKDVAADPADVATTPVNAGNAVAGNPVALAKLMAVGVPNDGAVNDGDDDNTTLPLPVVDAAVNCLDALLPITAADVGIVAPLTPLTVVATDPAVVVISPVNAGNRAAAMVPVNVDAGTENPVGNEPHAAGVANPAVLLHKIEYALMGGGFTPAASALNK